MIKSLFIVQGKDEKNYLMLFKDKFICSEEEIPEEVSSLREDDLEKKVLELKRCDKECKLVLGSQKALFFADLNNPNKKLKDLPSYKIIDCNILNVDSKYFIKKEGYFTLTLIAILIMLIIINIYLFTKYIFVFAIILLCVNFYKVKILEKIYYKKVLKKLGNI